MMLDAALSLAKHGLRVHPCAARGKNPIPDDWPNVSTNDPEVIEWMFDGRDNCNVGVKLGPDSGIVDIECDSPDAEQTLTDLFDNDPPVAPTYAANRGKHRLFKWSDSLRDCKSVFKIGNLEFRFGHTSGIQSVFPPSVHPSGKQYSWLPGCSIDDIDPPEIPAAVVAKLIEHCRGTTSSGKATTPKAYRGNQSGVAQGSRDTTSLSMVGRAISQIYDLGNDKEVEDAKAFLLAWNQGNKPPYDEAKIVSQFERILAKEHEKRGKTSNEAADDPSRLGRLHLVWHHDHADGCTLVNYREEVHAWDGNAYKVVPKEEFRAAVQGTVKHEFDRLNRIEVAKFTENPEDGKSAPTTRKTSRGLITNVVDAIASTTTVPGYQEQPVWLADSQPPFDLSECIVCRNGIVHLPSYIGGRECYSVPSTPLLFTSSALGCNFNPSATKPQHWLEFLGYVWKDDPKSIATLQEWFGYLLTLDTRQQKIMLLVGPKRSGKGTISRVLRALVRKENYAGPTLSSLGTNFGLAPLVGKPLAVISDARLGGRSDIAVIVERLLSISGEDAPTIDRKFLNAVTSKLPTRFMILTNELPRLGDSSGALVGRFIILTMTESWYGKEDTGLSDRLTEESELEGILNWSIEGWRRLNERGHFIQPESSREVIQEFEELSSPISAFLREWCIVESGRFIACDVLYQNWRAWCHNRGRDVPGDQSRFGRDLRTVIPGLKTTQRRGTDGVRFRAFEGIAINHVTRKHACPTIAHEERIGSDSHVYEHNGYARVSSRDSYPPDLNLEDYPA